MANSTPPTSTKRTLAVLFGAALAASVVAGCGSDSDEGSAEQRFCAAGEDLRADVTSLASLNVVASGVDGLTQSVDAIREDLSEMRDAGADVASSEIEALEAAIDDVTSSISDLGGDLSASNAASVITAIGAVGPAATAVLGVLTDTC